MGLKVKLSAIGNRVMKIKQVFDLKKGDTIEEGIILSISINREDNRITYVKTTKGTYGAYTFGYIQLLNTQ